MIATSCSKEESQTSMSIPDKSTAKQLEQEAYAHFGKLPESSRSLMFSNAESLLAGKVKKTTGDMELGETFVSIEGIINYNLNEELEMFDQTGEVTGTYQMDYYTSEGVNYVDDNEFAAVYQDMYNDLSSRLNLNDEVALLVDMEITEMDTINKFIRVRAFALSTQAPTELELWAFPDEGYYAVNGQGPCNGTPNGTDAADLLQGYLNAMAPWKNRCKNGIGYTVPIATLKTYDDMANDFYMTQDPNGGGNTWQTVINLYWKSNTNDCYGVTNQDWINLAGDVNLLRNYGLSRAQANINPNAEFHLADYHDHSGSNPDIQENLYHGGQFYYALITCAP